MPPPLRQASLSLLALCSACAQSTATHHPNLVLVAMDTVRWDHTSLGSYSRDTTPNLAGLAAAPGARVFDRAYTGASWSLPAYTTLFTGHEAISHGVGFSRGSRDRAHLTLAEILHAYGYRSAAFSSGPHLDESAGLAPGFEPYTHSTGMASLGRAVDGALGWLDQTDRDGAPFFLFVQGYDAHPPIVVPSALSEIFDPGYEGQVHDLSGLVSARVAGMGPTREAAWLETASGSDRLQEEERQQAAGSLLLEGGCAWLRVRGGPRIPLPEATDRAALGRLATAHGFSGGPLDCGPAESASQGMPPSVEALLVDGALDPALPIRVLGPAHTLTDADLQHYIAHYDAGVLTADLHLGRLLHGLEARGLLEDTILIALADHGEALGEGGQIGHDAEAGDAIFHVPLVVRMPDGAPPSRWEGVVSLADLLPTLTQTLSLTPAAGVTGTSFAGALQGPSGPLQPAREALEASMCCYAVRTAEWELRAARDPLPNPGEAVATGRPHTSAPHAWGPWRWELYQDGAGPDVADAHPEVVTRLSPLLADWFRPRGRQRVNPHGVQADRPDLKAALQEGGYWQPGDRPTGDHQTPEVAP